MCGPFHENGSFYPHYLECHGGTGRSIVLSTRLEITWPPGRHCLRPRSSVRLPVYPASPQMVGYSRESVYGIPPPVGWANGTGESNTGTILVDILRLPTGRLASTTPPGGIRVQQYPELVHPYISILH